MDKLQGPGLQLCVERCCVVDDKANENGIGFESTAKGIIKLPWHGAGKQPEGFERVALALHIQEIHDGPASSQPLAKTGKQVGT